MEKILLFRSQALGDMVFMLPLAAALKDGGYEVGWVSSLENSALIIGNPVIDHCHCFPIPEWQKKSLRPASWLGLYRAIREVRREKYDIALANHRKSNNIYVFILWLISAKRRISYRDVRSLTIRLGSNELIQPKVACDEFHYHNVERNLDFARYLKIDATAPQFSLPAVPQQVKLKVDALLLGIDQSKPIIIFAPGTTWCLKRWPKHNWVRMAKELNDKANIIFTGAGKDAEFVAAIISDIPGRIMPLNLVGKTDILELLEVFSRARIVVSPDSGSGNLAWASGKPAVISIFTCTPLKRFSPYSDNEKYFSLSGHLSCQPCFKKKCPLDCGQDACRNYPAVDDVIKIVERLIKTDAE